jgi:RNA polymerase sigma factor (TIGR02999 family)
VAVTDPPPSPSPGEVTVLLGALRGGDQSAWERLLAFVHADLKRIARAHRRRHPSGETLQTTELVNEAYMRLAQPATPDFNDRVHFLAVASRAMRHVLIDRARSRMAAKRGGGLASLDLEKHDPAAPERAAAVLVLDDALAELERLEPRLGRVVEMRFFGGMTAEEVGAALGVADRTVKSDWRKARAFLEARLASQGIGGRVGGEPI